MNPYWSKLKVKVGVRLKKFPEQARKVVGYFFETTVDMPFLNGNLMSRVMGSRHK